MSSQSPGIGSALPDMNANTSAQVLTNNGVVASWEDAASRGAATANGNSGKLLTTNGTAASWAAVTADSLLPSQSAKSGYFLSTNGTTVSWSLSLTALLPTQTGHSGELLSTDGSGTLSWISASGLTLAAFSATPSAEGLTLTGSALNLDPADATHPGGVTTGAQTIAGTKTISPGRLIVNDGQSQAILLDGSTTFSGLWLEAAAATAATYAIAKLAGDLYLNANTGRSYYFQINNVNAAKLTATALDLSYLGVGGAIKLQDTSGGTRTCTIDGATGLWVIV